VCRKLLIVVVSSLLSSLYVSATDDEPPNDIFAHLEWCSKAKDAPTRLSRHRAFWRRHRPDQGYEDAIHVKAVRLCAYRLAALFLETNNPAKCKEMLHWLETNDIELR
jgi:hypothetical protein